MRYFESPAYAEYCKRVYGCDMKQMGMISVDELSLLEQEIKLPSNSRILDIGCGSGRISLYLSEHYQSEVIGIDYDDKAIEYANKNKDNKALQFHAMDYNEIQYDDATFDMVCFIDTLYFTFTRDKLRSLLDKCYTMLKDNGKLVVFWTNLPQMFEMNDPAAVNTEVGKWGVEKSIAMNFVDLTHKHRQFWAKAYAVAGEMDDMLQNEIPDEWEHLRNERKIVSGLCKKGDGGGIFRWLYIFTKTKGFGKKNLCSG